MIERVVVPVNFTDDSERALLVAPVLASWAGAKIELVTVVAPLDRPDMEPRLARLAEAHGEGTTWRVVESGGPLEAVLVTELRRRDNTLWCVGSHARSALGELLRRSISEELARDAHLAVALVGPLTVATRGLRGGARLRHGSTSFQIAHRVGIPVAILHQL